MKLHLRSKLIGKSETGRKFYKQEDMLVTTQSKQMFFCFCFFTAAMEFFKNCKIIKLKYKIILNISYKDITNLKNPGICLNIYKIRFFFFFFKETK